MRHYNIPVFIPELACPHQCVFCDQHKIAGRYKVPEARDVMHIVKAHLATMHDTPRHVDIAFFGGSFTGMPQHMQEAYLREAYYWVENGSVQGIRLSTRPDYISEEIIALLIQYKVSCVELGAQSFDEGVLNKSGRGHSAKDIVRAAAMIKAAGMELVLQMMTGLPGDTKEKTLHTAREIIRLGASATRIYPALVIKGTQLETLYELGLYEPLTLDEAVERCKMLAVLFEDAGIKVLRIGLHPSEGLISGCELVAGPFHPAFGELVATARWGDILQTLIPAANAEKKSAGIRISVAPAQLNAVIGHQAANKKKLCQHFETVHFIADTRVTGKAYHVDYC